jgi:hypothetical protein
MTFLYLIFLLSLILTHFYSNTKHRERSDYPRFSAFNRIVRVNLIKLNKVAKPCNMPFKRIFKVLLILETLSLRLEKGHKNIPKNMNHTT